MVISPNLGTPFVPISLPVLLYMYVYVCLFVCVLCFYYPGDILIMRIAYFISLPLRVFAQTTAKPNWIYAPSTPLPRFPQLHFAGRCSGCHSCVPHRSVQQQPQVRLVCTLINFSQVRKVTHCLQLSKLCVRLFAGYTEKLHNSSMQFQSIKLMENAQARTRLKIKNNMFKLLLIAIEQRCVKSKSIRFPQSIFE